MTFNPIPRRYFFTMALLAMICVSCARLPPKAQAPADFQAFVSSGNHQKTLINFDRYLRTRGVGNVIPVEQLLRQGTDWKAHRLPQYAFPPEQMWPKMVDTLKFMRRFIIPAIGPIEVMSGFRTSNYNQIAGGAKRSQHLEFSALDARPASDINRTELHKRLQRVWRTHGKGLNMGLGLYSGRRFHIDTGGYRQW